MILVTGATGFVGTHLLSAIAAQGLAVRPVGRNGGNGLLAVGDIDAQTDWSAALDGVDTVVHLAARVHVMHETNKDPLAASCLVNRYATINLARQAHAAGAQRLVFISSIKVNGEATESGKPFSAASRASPVDPYGQSKWAAEQELHLMAAETGFEIVIIRPPLIYGPGVKANFRSLMSAVYRRLPLPLGAVRNKRSLLAVGNLVDLIIRCTSHPAAAGRMFLAADGQDLSTAELTRQIGIAMGRPAVLVPVPPALLHAAAHLLGQGDVARRLLSSLQVDFTETRRVLEWQPPVPVEVAIRETVTEFLHSRTRNG